MRDWPLLRLIPGMKITASCGSTFAVFGAFAAVSSAILVSDREKIVSARFPSVISKKWRETHTWIALRTNL